MSKYFFSFVLFLVSFNLGLAQSKYSKIKIDLSKTSIQELNRLGLETDHGSLIPGVHFVNDFSTEELQRIEQAGISYSVVIDDLKADYKLRSQQAESQVRESGCEEDNSYNYTTPENYTYGSMGGYHTYDELLEVLNDMREKFPNLITETNAVEGIKTWEENDIIWLRISDNPDVDEDEPEALYTALHHAREPNSLSQMIFYMWYLLENYETNEEVKYLVDNTEMYFMPCVNPDGYKFNELTDPEGGGFWRKNRRQHDDSDEVGVDLNRNYGFFWGFDNFGSSPNKGSSTYRGPQAFSEPESQAVRAFCIAHNFRISLNYHTHGNLLIHPWGYNDQPTDEDELFKALGNTMNIENNYLIGTGTETVGYVVNGDSDDYMYGEEAEKNKIYSFTPEVGPRFWPSQSQIDQLNKACLLQNLNTAHLLLNYYDARIADLNPLVSQRTGSMNLITTKSGLLEGDATITIESNNLDYLTFDEFTFQYSLESGKKSITPLSFTISENTPPLQDLSFDVVADNGMFTIRNTYTFTYRNSISEEVLIDEFNELSNWEGPNSDWGLTTEYFVSAPNALTDSPNGIYENNRMDVINLIDQLPIGDGDFTSLKFNARWEIEYNYDYALIQVSNDNGLTWTSLCGEYTRPGVNTHGTDDPLYDGIQSDWVVEEIDLTEYNGKSIQLRLMFVSDQAVELDGFYIDDLMVVTNTLVVTNTDDVLDANAFSIQPSLNNGSFEILIDDKNIDQGNQVEIFDMQGKRIHKTNVSSTRMSVQLEGVAKGVYVVKFSTLDGKSVSKKVHILGE
ncbi:MAG: M14 family zinc carboxypeptidase [Saprospiraceae bacterium]|nr:M14 family zinc carboxypeptidase [Saprospiraceae bacterium]